jgi:endoglucanase
MVVLALAFSVVARPVDDHGSLSVVNGVMVDKNGNPPQLRGMSLFWDLWGYDRYYTSETVTRLSNDWGANLVRASIGTSLAPSSGIAVASTAHAITIIDAAIDNGIYVIVDWHSHYTETEAAKTFFSAISAHVKDKGNPPNVIYEIFNEPIKQTWTEIKTFADAVIPVIRANSPDNIIIVGTPEYSATVDAPLVSPLTATNVVYAFHFYASAAGHLYNKSIVSNAVCKGLPVFVSEWGLSVADGGLTDKTLNWEWIKGWVSFMENMKLSWANWSISDKNESSAALISQTVSADIGLDSKLTTSGAYVKNLIKTLNSGGTHADVSSSSMGCSSASFPRDGILDIATDSWLDAENYSSASGTTTVSDKLAIGDAYESGISTGDLLAYTMSTPQDTILIFTLKYRNTGVPATVSFTSGGKDVSFVLATNASWNTVEFPIKLVQGAQNVQFGFAGVDGMVDMDYMSFLSPDSSDSVTWALDTWREATAIGRAYPQKSGLKLDLTSTQMLLRNKGPRELKVAVATVAGRRLREWAIPAQGEIRMEKSDLPQGMLFFYGDDGSGMRYQPESFFNWQSR